MFRNYLFVILMLSAVSPIGFFGQQRAGDVKKSVVEQEKTAIARLENKWLVALNNADINAIAEVLDEDFARPAPDSGQFVHKAELLQFYRSHLSPLASGQQKRIQEMSVSVYGSTALARGVLITTDPDGRIVSQAAVHGRVCQTCSKVAGDLSAGKSRGLVITSVRLRTRSVKIIIRVSIRAARAS